MTIFAVTAAAPTTPAAMTCGIVRRSALLLPLKRPVRNEKVCRGYLGECQSLRHVRRRFSTRAKRAQKFPVGSEKASAIRRGRRASREGVERVGRGRRVALVPGALERGGVLFRAPAVNLHVVAPHASRSREIVVRFPPVERPLDHLADAVDPVESHGEQTAGEKRDVLVRYREYERPSGVDEEEGDEIGHLDVPERNGVATTQLHDFSAASTRSHSRYRSNAPRSHTCPSLR